MPAEAGGIMAHIGLRRLADCADNDGAFSGAIVLRRFRARRPSKAK
jgi:hypothetical protein